MAKKKKSSVFAASGLVVLVLAFIAMGIILINMPAMKIFPGNNSVIEQDYEKMAMTAVQQMPEYSQYQGTNLMQTSKRLISEGAWEYSYSFSSGSINASPAPLFNVKVLVLPGETRIIEFGMVSGFCGSSTYDICTSDSECSIGGCSGQVCQSVNTEPVFTTCEYRDCFNAQQYEVICKCYQGKCRWI